jgi:hypothetical protein
MNVRKSKLNSLHKRSRKLVLLAVLSFTAAVMVGLLGLCSCAHSEKGLQREIYLHDAASNTITTLQPVVQAAPAPVNTILGTVFAGLSGLLAVWATHIHRSVTELRKGNGSGDPKPATPEG